MRPSNSELRFMGGVLLIAVVVSCGSPVALGPTLDIQPTLNAVQTQSAGTVIADLTLNAPPATPPPPPTEDIQPTLDAIQTQAAATVIADLTLNAPPATPSPPPTEDIQATLIAVQTQSAATVIADLTQNAPTATPSGTPTKKPTVRPACSVSRIAPKTNTIFYTKDDFDAAWVLTNNSKTTWFKDEVDIYYSSGDKLQKWIDMMDLEEDIASGKSYTLAIDMTAPADPGTYTTTWVAYSGQKLLCTMTVTIIVKPRE